MPNERDSLRVYELAKQLAEACEVDGREDLRQAAVRIRDAAFLELLALAGVDEVPA